ncbi:LacI family DNA-binding transcriptional regulator [Nakamurella endophytica]|uniref:Transcriptional regulator n=1 Tax=Nakamurella endophytica TaxID=1748367 RepID=A0A917TEF1_9ACTN|nr:LacI family DNA-binding transcriptional regulator [Nakamurella endophytica]GGM19309.1 transcriptional regulator [Nakamurella endophytica]
MTLQTIADAVGVSRMTVSNAFSGSGRISAELRDRVLAAADELGYAGPDPAARAFTRGSTGVVGVLVNAKLGDVFSDEVSSALLGGVADGLTGSGLSLTLLSTQEAVDGRIPARDVPMDATLVFTNQYDAQSLHWLQRRSLPLVLLDQEPLAGVAAVNVDDLGGARQAAEHLLQLGHRRIGIVTVGLTPPFGLQTDPFAALPADEAHITRQRIQGWVHACSAAQVTPVMVKQPKTPYQPEAGGYAALNTMLEVDPTITGVLCYSDRFAHGVLNAAHDRGLRVPDDLSVIGFDDSPIAVNLRPPLTTVRQDPAEKGRVAAALLIAAVRNDHSARNTPAPDAARKLLPTLLISRASTAVPPVPAP